MAGSVMTRKPGGEDRLLGILADVLCAFYLAQTHMYAFRVGRLDGDPVNSHIDEEAETRWEAYVQLIVAHRPLNVTSNRRRSSSSFLRHAPPKSTTLPALFHALAVDFPQFLPRSILIATTSTMWDDEDNNPYGSFARHDSNSSDVPGLASPGACKAPASLLWALQQLTNLRFKYRSDPRHRHPRLPLPHKSRRSTYSAT